MSGVRLSYDEYAALLHLASFAEVFSRDLSDDIRRDVRAHAKTTREMCARILMARAIDFPPEEAA